jgi:hypothetical protein
MSTSVGRRSFLGVLASLPAALAWRGAARAAGTEVLIDEFFVAGYQFHDGPRVERALAPGVALQARREPDNPHDTRAIGLWLCDAMVGYVPRRANRVPARMVDGGVGLRYRVLSVEPQEEPWLRVRVGEYLAR